jgi:energy-coupling factor transporter ATP-binding protein EcfA2
LKGFFVVAVRLLADAALIKRLTIESFKSLEKVEIELGRVNVFVGANGSGKSNLLEAVGVLSAAANGKVDDQSLLQRGVRPGVPRLYKSAFRRLAEPSDRQPPHIFFGAHSKDASFEVSLHNPLTDPLPAWQYKTERLQRSGDKDAIASRGPNMRQRPHPEQGIAALQAVELVDGDPARELLETLQGYVIYTPATSVLRGTMPETQPRSPLGLSGGQLPEALAGLQKSNEGERVQRVLADALDLIGWAKSYETAPASTMPLSPAAAASARVIKFVDRYMAEGRNVLSGYDASEGALYVLFLAVLAGHPLSPRCCAVDNADHGLNPRLARSLMNKLSTWYLGGDRQILITTHNPLVLDGLLLDSDDVRLFTVSRTDSGRTTVTRVEISPRLRAKASEGWTLSRLWVMGHLGGVGDV